MLSKKAPAKALVLSQKVGLPGLLKLAVGTDGLGVGGGAVGVPDKT